MDDAEVKAPNGLALPGQRALDIESMPPYLVVRLIAAIYQREAITVEWGPTMCQVGHRRSVIRDPDPLDKDGALRSRCRKALVKACHRPPFRSQSVIGM